MKVSYNWLREFLDISADAKQLAERLTLIGLEVSAITSAHPGFRGVVVAEVMELTPHPDADKLRVCKMNTGHGALLQIVCGASNVRVGMKAPLVKVDGVLPDGGAIKRAKLRGIESEGMLCSARELGLSADATGLLELPAEAPIGKALDEYFGLDDSIFEIELTPNRGDCLSTLGFARDLSALYDKDIRLPDILPVQATIKDFFDVIVEVPDACPVYASRVIKHLRSDAQTPIWMRERLRRAGLQSIHPVVDVTQYVMLELGQPMHAYDLRHLTGGIVVRKAKADESAKLLDGQTYSLTEDVLVIADHAKCQGLGGIMGGGESAVQADTTDVFLEAAFFAPAAISGRPRRMGLVTDAGYRFERGVDPAGQQRAIERATRLILDICGGEPGPVREAVSVEHVPRRPKLVLRRTRLEHILGIRVPDTDVWRILTRLGMQPESCAEGWRVMTPSYRFDIGIEADLVEEVGRIYGYDRIPVQHYAMPQSMGGGSEARLNPSRLRDVLVERGYQEAITYSFVAPALQQLFFGGKAGPVLGNPISAELSEMRLGLWPGLVSALQYNLNRQQSRMRLFEIGMRFIPQVNEIKQENMLAGIVFGDRYPEQWGSAARPLDFADIKNDVEALLVKAGAAYRAQYVVAEHPALHPGQSARIELKGQEIGWLGALHPSLAKELDLDTAPYLFEITIEPLLAANIPQFAAISRYPSIRRDIAVSVPETVPGEALVRAAREAVPEIVQEAHIFDIYRGQGVDFGRKSVALGLILQDSSRTLTDEAADAAMARISERLQHELGAITRD